MATYHGPRDLPWLCPLQPATPEPSCSILLDLDHRSPRTPPCGSFSVPNPRSHRAIKNPAHVKASGLQFAWENNRNENLKPYSYLK